MSCYLGVDQSLSSTGLCILDGDELEDRPQYLAHLSNKEKLKGGKRLAYIYDHLLYVLNRWHPDACASEGYAYNAVGKAFELGEVGGLVKLACARVDPQVPHYVVAPASLKKFVGAPCTGDKAKIADKILDIWGYKIQQNDEADAYVLAKIMQGLSNKKSKLLTRNMMEVIKGLKRH